MKKHGTLGSTHYHHSFQLVVVLVYHGDNDNEYGSCDAKFMLADEEYQLL